MKKAAYLSVIVAMLYSANTFGLESTSGETTDPFGKIDFGGDFTVSPVEATDHSNQSAPPPSNSAKVEETVNANTFDFEDIAFEPINPDGDATVSYDVPDTQSAPAKLTQIKPINPDSDVTAPVNVPKSQSAPLPTNSTKNDVDGKEPNESNNARREQLLKQLEESIKLIVGIRTDNTNPDIDNKLAQLSEQLIEGTRFVKNVNNPNASSNVSDSNFAINKLRQLSEQLIESVLTIENMIDMQNRDRSHT